MKKRVIKILIYIVCILLICGCESDLTDSSKNTESKEEVSTGSLPSEETVSEESLKPSATPSTESVTGSSSQTQSTTEIMRLQVSGDILLSMKESGKTVSAYGELRNDEYIDALQRLASVLDGYKHNISVVVYSLDNKKALGYNTAAGIFGACTVKAPYALYCCKQMDSGKVTLDTKMTYQSKHYETGTGDMQYSPFGTVFSMETVINKSMGISDNVGYLMMVDCFGRDGYNSYIKNLGCPSLMIKPTVWSLRTKARELAIAWREIYYYFKSGAMHSDFLYKTCTNTSGNYATVSIRGVDYSHKQGHNRTGDWLSYSDAGIVWKAGSPYIIAIITDAPGPSSYEQKTFSEIMQIIHNEIF